MTGAGAELELPREIAHDLRPARALVLRAWGEGIRPDPERTCDEWADAERVVSAEGGSPAPGPWETSRTPYLREIMQVLSLSHPARKITFKKSAQIAGTEAGVNLLGQVMAETPTACLVLLPSRDDAKDYNSLKLQPTIDATPALSRRVRNVVSRSRDASTKTLKKFPGGFLQISSANTSKGLQMRSFRVVVLEEITEYPWDVGGRGDPIDLAEARTIAHSGREKIYANSTPALEGACRISSRYEESSKARYLVPCPHCGERQALEWERLRWTEGKPATAEYACSACGVCIPHRHKRQMLAWGVWQHERPELVEIHPGYWINSLYSPFLSWADLVAKYERARDDGKLKAFVQQYLGRAFRETGEAPDHERLFERREERPRGVLPAGALFLVGACDVQGDRLEWSVYAYGAGLTSWLIDGGVIAHAPTDPLAWRELRKITRRHYPDARGRAWPIDAFGVDTGYASQEVYRFALEEAHSERIFALDGRGDPRLAPLSTPTKRDVDADGAKIGVVKLWPVGTFGLKLAHYAAIRATIKGPDDAGAWPRGALLLPAWISAEHTRQLCSEYLETVETRRGAERREWRRVAGVRNEWLDCAVYARALAHHISDPLTSADWLRLAERRSADLAQAQMDLAGWWSDRFAVGDGQAAAAELAEDAAEDPAEAPAPAPGAPPAAPPAAVVVVMPPPAPQPAAAPAGRRLGGVGRRLA